MLYPMLPNALNSRMVRLREVSFAGHPCTLGSGSRKLGMLTTRALGGCFNTSTASIWTHS